MEETAALLESTRRKAWPLANTRLTVPDSTPFHPGYFIARREGEHIAEETLEELRCLPLTILSPEPDTILKAARLKSRHARSYPDAFAVVTAQELQATLLTEDPEILQLTGAVTFEPLQRG
ncbi:MAG TPA: PIN domain-containing protein [Candidatus Binatia bacterium]|nr:PIN domain-containing protein [Candidatus Binatia bacterium]